MFDFLKRKKKPTDEIKINEAAAAPTELEQATHIDDIHANADQIDSGLTDKNSTTIISDTSSVSDSIDDSQEKFEAAQRHLEPIVMTETLKAPSEVELPEQKATVATDAATDQELSASEPIRVVTGITSVEASDKAASNSQSYNSGYSDSHSSYNDSSILSDASKNHVADVSNNAPEKKGFLTRLKEGLAKTRASFGSGIANLFLGKKTLDKNLLDEIEMALLTADVGVETTERLIKSLTDKLARNELTNSDAAFEVLRSEMRAILKPCEKALDTSTHKPYVILVIGINGSGKTTTIGKMACHYKQLGKNVMLAAGDTFRAAAIDQLQVWGERNQIPVIAQQPGADTAAVIFDAMEAAKARGCDILIADTAGRLHTQTNLMGELQKVKRVLAKLDPTAPHEVLIVLDSTLGQNALNQVIQFNQALGITGIALTKLDGTAKGGIIFAIANQTGIPIRFIGVGEGIHDLRPFEADAFVEALFS